MAGITFLLGAGSLFWAKTPDISSELPVDVSLHAYSEYTDRRATFTANLGGAYLPAISIPVNGELSDTCSVKQNVVITGRIACLAETDSAGFFVLLLTRDAITVGRNRLWRVRDEVASSLAIDLRDLLSRRRTGVVRSDPPGTSQVTR
jgi:hypothetical protein